MMSKGKGIPEYDDDPTHHHLACAPAGFFAMPPRAAELPIRRWNGAGNRRRAWALQGFILWAQALRRARAPRAWRRLAARFLEHERLSVFGTPATTDLVTHGSLTNFEADN